jgi:hypothetical protein
VAPSASDLSEDLVTAAAALGQAGFRELHAQPRHLVLRNEHNGVVGFELVGDALALEILDDRVGILEREIGEQRGHLGRCDAHHDEGKEADECDRDSDHGRHSRCTQ